MDMVRVLDRVSGSQAGQKQTRLMTVVYIALYICILYVVLTHQRNSETTQFGEN